MVCPNCGGNLPERTRACPHCGAPCAADAGAQPAARRSTVALILALLALLCAGIGVLYYLVLRGIGSNFAAAPEADSAVSAPETEEEEASETVSLTPQNTEKTDGAEESKPAVTLTLSKDALRLQPGAQEGLSVSVRAADGRDVYVFWSSSDETVATVDSAGMVTAVAEGECILTASSGAYSASCRVTVDAAAASAGYLLPSDTVILTADDLKGMTQEEVMLARNEIFARHGRVFKTASIQAHFESCAWYVPDPDFDENTPGALSAIEQANLRLLIEYETEHGWR